MNVRVGWYSALVALLLLVSFTFVSHAFGHTGPGTGFVPVPGGGGIPAGGVPGSGPVVPAGGAGVVSSITDPAVTTTAVSLVKLRSDQTGDITYWIFVFEGTEIDLRSTPNYQIETQTYIQELATAPDAEVVRQRMVQEARDRITNPATGYGRGTVESLQDMEVNLYYYDISGVRKPVDNCGSQPMPLRTSTQLLPDATPANPDDDIYYAICEIPRGSAFYPSGTCRTFQASYTGQAGRFKASSFTDEICDVELAGIPAFSSALGSILQPAAQNYLLLFGAFVMGGLMLASMYFSGKSPLSLLDVATPRLPSPKSLMPAGQILGPFGYTEAKGAARKMMGTDVRVFKAEVGILGARLGAGIMGDINRRALNVVKSATYADRLAGDVHENKDFFRALATLAAKYNVPHTEWAHLNVHLYRYSEGQQEALARLLQKLERLAKDSGSKRDLLLLEALGRFYRSTVLYQHLEALTGHPTAGKRFLPQQAVQWAIAKGFGHYKLLRPHVAGMYDSLPRGAWQFGRFIKATGREVKQRVFEVQEKASKGRVKMVEPAPTRMVMGSIAPIPDKMAYMYRSLYNEAHRDMMRYTLSQMLSRYGVSLRMSEMELLEMGYKDKDVLRLAGILKAPGEFFRMESEARSIISALSRVTNEHERTIAMDRAVRDLIALAHRHGVAMDYHGVEAALQHVQQIETMGSDERFGHVKLLELSKYLQDSHGTNDPTGHHKIDDTRFTFLIGRDNIPGNKAWELMTLRTFMYDLEHGMLTGNLTDSLKSTWMNVINRLCTLTPINLATHQGTGYINPGEGHADLFPGFTMQGQANLVEFKKIQERVVKYASELLTDAGKAKFRQLNGRDISDTLAEMQRLNGLNHNDAKVQAQYAKLSGELQSILFGKAEMKQRYEVSDLMGGREKKTGQAHWWGSREELGPDPNWWKTDMKRHWTDGPGPDFALLEWVEKRFSKSYLPYYKADIERELNDRGITNPVLRGQEARKLLARDLLMSEIREFGNSIWAENAYGTTNMTHAYYAKTAAGILMAALKEHDPKTYHDGNPAIRFLHSFDPGNAGNLTHLQQLMRDHDAEFQGFLKTKVTYDTISKSNMAWVMTYEGGFVPWVSGMPLSDRDRVYGYIAMKDDKKVWRRFDPDTQQVHFGGSALDQAYGALVGSNEKEPEKWRPFLRDAQAWAGSDYERLKSVNGALWHYAQATNDWNGFWAQSELKMKPKHEVAPLPPTFVRFLYSHDMPMEKGFQKMRNWGLEFGHSISRIWQEAASELTYSSYAGTPYSEYLREWSWRYAKSVKEGRWDELTAGLSGKDKDEVQKAYMAGADAHPEYHQFWDWVWDRNPQRGSTAYGSRHRWETKFQYGPYGQFEMRHTYEATMTKAELATSEALFWPMRAARKAAYYFTSVFRPIQESMLGAVTKWDTHESGFKRTEHIPNRPLEALRTMLNPWAASGGTEFGIKSSTVHHDLSGRRLSMGLKVAPQDVSYVQTGTYANARTGESNPGASLYNFRYMLDLDPAMAEYLAYRSPHAAFFRNDPYVREQSRKTSIKHEVASEALAMERERELRGFSPFQNQIWGWFSPLAFVWHGAAGYLPSALIPKEWFSQGAKKWKQSGGAGLRGWAADEAKGIAEDFYHGINDIRRPSMAWLIVYCPRCSKAGRRGDICSRCKSPTGSSYLY